jgi:uncharacterized protein
MIRNITRKKILHERPVWATGMLRQAVGLMFRKPTNEAIIFLFMPARKDVLQMWFVFGPVDVAVLDGAGKVLALKILQPWSIWAPKMLASCIIELPSGTIAASGTRVGDTIVLPQITSSSIWRWWHYGLFFLVHILLAVAVALILIVTIVK